MWKALQVGVRALRSGVQTAGSAGLVRDSVRGWAGRSCTVDPGHEEQFVFEDCTDPDNISSSAPPPASLPLAPAPPLAPARKSLRSLERQLQVLKNGAVQDVELDSLVQFHDKDFPLDESIVAGKKNRKKKTVAGKGEHKVVGSPDVNEPISDTCCSGCGALLHCTSTAVPGYLPSEKFKELQREQRLSGVTCQRCHLLTHHHKALNVQMTADQYRSVVQRIRPYRALVLLIVDLLDLPDSIVPALSQLVGTNKSVVVLGNKVDLLPADSSNYLQRVKGQLTRYCQDAGFGAQVTSVHLISAKTGYGVENLISSLQKSWKYQGDVYLVGTANAGKSTLFNTLLQSDYCKTRARDLIHKATISPWPGTTLNLLKFPILNPTPLRIAKRQERLKEEARQEDETQNSSRGVYLRGSVGKTFHCDVQSRDEIQFDPDDLSFGEEEDRERRTETAHSRPDELTWNELKDARWLFDTPGIMKENDILSLLTEQEVVSVIPSQVLVPRTFVLKPSMSLLLGALARIDFLQGKKSCWFSVLASARLPVHITKLEKVDDVYQKHAGHALLGVPLGGSERMTEFPPLVPEEITLTGRGHLEASADITLSSAGWVAVTAAQGDCVVLRVHAPVSVFVRVRNPPLLPHVVSLKGERIKKSAAYKTVRRGGVGGRC